MSRNLFIKRISFSFIIFYLGTLFPLHANALSKPTDSLEVISSDHILEFEKTGVHVSSRGHFLKIRFEGTHGVKTNTEQFENDGKQSHKLYRVTYRNLWPGIDLTFEQVDKGIMESIYLIEPGTDAGQIRLNYNAPVKIDTTGNLLIDYQNGVDFHIKMPSYY